MAGVEELPTELRQRKTDGKSCADTSHHRTLLVLELSSKVKEETVDWLAAKICGSQSDGGAALVVRKCKNENKKAWTLHVGGRSQRLLLAAELMEIKKPCKDGSQREISADHLQLFVGSDDLDGFLTMAEKQRIILHELELIRALEDDTNVPGLTKTKLYHGEAIVPRLMHNGKITQLYPLHDKEQLKYLATEWYQVVFRRQPIERIQNYFGDTIAMYFSFLGFYKMALVPPAVIGLLSIILVSDLSDLDLIIFFSVFNLVWATIFLEVWKRNCATLSYTWGTINSEPFEESRPGYYGFLGTNPVTERLEPKYPKWKRLLKFYGVSVPVVMLCLFGAVQVMLWYFYWEGLAIAYDKEHKTMFSGYLLFIPSVVYAIIITILNAIYRWLANALTDWENHRLESAYENHLIMKLVLFDFVNCFLSLFYIAFYLKDMKLLRTSLATLLIVQQIIQQCQETLVPYLIYKFRKTSIKKRHKKQRESDQSQESDPLLDEEEEISEIEGAKDAYLGTLDDYLELFLQFGYVFLFSAVYPAAAFWALINNVMEIRSDAFKLCRVFQRPFSRPTAGIGAWQMVFEVMGIMAVLTNCALVAYSPHIKELLPGREEVDILMLFVIAEHMILLVKLILAYVIPDEPEWVQTALQKLEYQSKKAWRQQRYQEAQKMLKDQASCDEDEQEVNQNEEKVT